MSSVDPPGELYSVRVGYMLDLRGTNVRRGDSEGKCGAKS
jgi:hypothetical protein